MIATMAELSAALLNVQACRAAEVRCELSPELSARTSDAALAESFVTELPMVQGVRQRIVRSRGRGAVIMARLRYRDGVRMLEGDTLTQEEAAALEMARSIAAGFRPLDEAECFRHVYTWVCQHIVYNHTAPGQKGYERLVGASGALMDRQANCQGFADVVYLLCGLCGIECEYRCGRGNRQLHVWNAVRVNGEWRDVDASKGARNITD